MKTILLKTQTGKCNIVIGYNIVNRLGQYLKSHNIDESIFIISSPAIYGRYGYGKKIRSVLEKSGFDDIDVALFPDGEENKSFETYKKLLTKLIEFDGGKERKITVIALGGGVIGDVVGFVASTYRRGVPLVQIPSTLLAMVDSSIGGKTGIDFQYKNRTIKNIIGQFYQPKLILIDLSFLETLPKKELLNGLAEVIKYGVICDKELFEYLQIHTGDILKLKPKSVTYVVSRCAGIKSKIVEQDEKETKSVRTILNFGHTIGHAIEGATGFKYTHGEAISVGMLCEAEIGWKLGLIDKTDVLQIENLISRIGLPTKIYNCNLTQLMKIMRYDKKFQAGMNRFVLPTKIGKTTIKVNIKEKTILSVLVNRILNNVY